MGLWEMIKGEQPGIINSILNYGDAGHYGEYLAQYALNNNNLSGYLKTIVNLYIPYKGKTTEIDVAMIHEKGFFIFESKNYAGWIFGSVDQKNWTQCLPNKEKHNFYNPILQNRTHIKAISSFLELPIEAFSSYIIFAERSVLKKVPVNTDEYTILNRNYMLKNLRKVLSEKPVIYTKEQVDKYVEKLESTANKGEEQKKQHVENIKELTEGNVCPFCGKELKERSGKYGNFYGCSGYPKCRFTKKI